MTDGLDSDRACGFVLEEMRVDGQFISRKNKDDLSRKNKDDLSGKSEDDLHDYYDDCHDPKKIRNANDKDRAFLFYRYIAHQKYRMPLPFYQDAVAYLEKARQEKSLPDKTVNDLYAILAETTTGDNYRYFVKDVGTGRAQWQSIVDNIRAIDLKALSVFMSNDGAKTEVVSELAKLTVIPALPLLTKLVAMSSIPLHKPSVTEGLSIRKNLAPRLKDNNKKLAEFAEQYKSKVYIGMQHYSEADYGKKYPEDRNLFEEHLEICRLLKQGEAAEELLP